MRPSLTGATDHSPDQRMDSVFLKSPGFSVRRKEPTSRHATLQEIEEMPFIAPRPLREGNAPLLWIATVVRHKNQLLRRVASGDWPRDQGRSAPRSW
jgi:hypothetical protein